MSNINFKNLKSFSEIKIHTIDFNGSVLEVKNYVPVQTKLEMISNVLNNSINDARNSFYNPVKVEVFLAVEFIQNYTNIEIDDEEEIPVIYDILKTSDILQMVIDITKNEYQELYNKTFECIKAIYEYEHSVMGVLERFNENTEEIAADAEAIKEKLSNPESLALLKDIMTTLG